MKPVITELPIDLKMIEPNVPAGQSDKYSRYLFNWVKRNRKRYGAGIYCLQRNWSNGEFSAFDYVTADRPDIFIGFTDGSYLSGIRLNSILVGNRDTGAYQYGPNLINITDWFWKEYVNRGRCVFDADHDKSFLYDDSRYVAIGNSRCCNWCGMQQELRVEEVIVKRERWIATVKASQ